MKAFFQKNWIHFIAIAIGLIAVSMFNSPQLEGNALKQHDINEHKGMSNEIWHYRNETGEEVGWTNSMFGGMPATQISIIYNGNYISKINSKITSTIGVPISIMFLYFVGFYILMMCLKINPIIGIIAALAFSFCSYDIIILKAGHNSKGMAIAFMAPVVGAFYLTYKRNLIWGIILSALFMAFEMCQNHLQITYYLGFLIVGLGVVAFFEAIKEKKIIHFGKATIGILLAYGLAFIINAGNILGTVDYSEGTIRGGNDITITPEGGENNTNTTSGLDRDYVVNWSNGIGESLSILTPYVKGGASEAVGNSQFAEDIMNSDLATDQINNATNSSAYWGNQPFVSGPAYIGVITVFLAFIGLFLIKSPWKWGLFAATILTIALSWGKNYMGLTNFFLDNVPGYNKFRAVTIIIVVAELAIPLLAALLLNELYTNKDRFKEKIKLVYISSGLFLLILVAIKFGPLSENLMSENDIKQRFEMRNQITKADPAQLKAAGIDKNNPQSVTDFINKQTDGVKESRQIIFNASLNTSIVLTLLAIGILIFLSLSKLTNAIMLAGICLLGLINLIDLWNVGANYVNNEDDNDVYKHWESRLGTLFPVSQSAADAQILQAELAENPSLKKIIMAAEKEGEKVADDYEAEGLIRENIINSWKFMALNAKTNYRVWDIQGNWNSSNASYYHKSLGGYHGAKLRNINNLFEFHLSKGNNSVYDMMNVKYMIQTDQKTGDKSVSAVSTACGPVWFIESIKTVKTPNDAILSLGTKFNLENEGKGTLLVNKKVFPSKDAYGSETLQYVLGIDTLTIPMSNGLKEGMVVHFVRDTAGRVDLIPDTMLKLDQFNSFDKLVKINVANIFEPKVEAMMLESELGNTAKKYKIDGVISMSSYKPNRMVYASTSKTNQFAVFSEVYYDKGWTATIDGKNVVIKKVNYLLRGLEIPAGKHDIVFTYVTPKLKTTNFISSISCLLLFASIGVGLYLDFRKKSAIKKV